MRIQRTQINQILVFCFLVSVLLFQPVFALEQSISFDLGSDSAFEVVETTRKPIQLGEPVTWEVLLTDGSGYYSLLYETDPIFVEFEEKAIGPDWSRYLVLTTDYSGIYENVQLKTRVPPVHDLVLNPAYDFTFQDGRVALTIPEIDQQKELTFSGTLEQEVKTYVFETDLGVVQVSLPKGQISDFSIIENEVYVQVVGLEPEDQTTVTLNFDFALPQSSRPFTLIDNTVIPLPATYTESGVQLDGSAMFQLNGQIAQGLLTSV